MLPEIVNTRGNDEKSVAYTELIPVLIEAMKEQQNTISELKEKVKELEREMKLKGTVASADTYLP